MGSFRFARRYLGNRFLFLFLRLLRCFTLPRYSGNLGINACLTASPSFSQPSTPLLLTPRHPPHALSSLTTMILASQPTPPRHRRLPRLGIASQTSLSTAPRCRRPLNKVAKVFAPPKGHKHRQHAMFLRVLFFIPDTLGSGERIPPKALRIGLRCHSCRYQIAKEQTAN